MGFLDQEADRLKRLEFERQAKSERAKSEGEGQADSQKTLRAFALGDNRLVVALLDNLPDVNFGDYLNVVKDLTRYTPRIVLYTRMALLYGADRNKLLLGDQELLDKLEKKGITATTYTDVSDGDGGGGTRTEYIGMQEPGKIFCGDNVRPKKWLAFPITEPQEPGIGIRLINEDAKPNRLVYVRLTPSANAIMTGVGNRVQVTSLKVFDGELYKAFRHTHTLIESKYRSRQLSSGGTVIGNG